MPQLYKRVLCLLCFLWLAGSALGFGANAGPQSWRAAREPGRSASAIRLTRRKDAWKSKVTPMSWFDGGDEVLEEDEYGYLYDIDTGLVVHIKRMGGVNHADCEPAGKSDTAKLWKIAGGEFSWESHAAILYADGHFVACAINTLPHGDQTLPGNSFDGHFCLHMAGSRTHDSDLVNEAHQSNILKAYNWAHHDE